MPIISSIIDVLKPLGFQALTFFNELVINSSSENLFLMGVMILIWFFFLYWFLFLFVPGFIMDKHLRYIPQVPGKLPLFGHALLLMGGSPCSKMAKWSLESYQSDKDSKKNNTQNINRIVQFSVFQQRVVYINEPALIKRVLLTNQRNYIKDIQSSYKPFMCLLGSGLVTAEGEKWKKGRLLLSHALRIDILEEIPEMAVKAVGRVLNKLAAIDDKVPFVDMNEEFRHMTLQVIGETALSLSPEETDRIFPALYLPIVHECNRMVWEPWRSFMPFSEGYQKRRNCLKKLNKILSEIIQNRWNNRHNNTTRDIMVLCMSQIDKMDADMILQLRDDVKTILFAGHETSAALLTWATYEVICHPDIRDKIVEEAKILFDPERCNKKILTSQGITWGIPSASDVRKFLKWSPAVLRETLRKYSVVPLVMRVPVKNDTWPASETGLDRDIIIPAGCSVAVGIQAVHHRPDIWPNPEEFKPERFIDVELVNNINAQGNEKKYEKCIDPYAFIPFINGPRNCLGQHLAMMETEVALAFLFLNWDLSLYNSKEKVNDAMKQNLQEEVGQPHEYLIPIVPRDGLKVVGKPRK